MRISGLTILLLCLTLPTLVQAQHDDNLPTMTAPAQAHQFDFLIGQWDIELTPKVSGLVAAIHGAPRMLGTWKAWPAFDGFGIDDELRVVDGSGNPVSLSSARRIFDPGRGHWLISGLDVYRARFSNATAEWKDGEMLANGGGVDQKGNAYRSRTRFSEISPEGFRMQQDRSYDEGVTWEEEVIVIQAKRVAKTASR